MDNIFLNFLYIKEFNNRGVISKIKNYFKYKKFLYNLKRKTPSFEIMWQFAQYLRWVDLIYGFGEEENSDIDLIKKRNPYFIDQTSGEEIEISFTIILNDRSKIYFNLVKSYKTINIDVSRSKIRNSEDKYSSISFNADETHYEFSYYDKLMICEINRALQHIMVKYMKMFYEKIK